MITSLAQKFLDRLRLFRQPSQPEALGQTLEVGGLYSVIRDSSKGTFSIVKILVLEPSVVHLCLYANTFLSRPEGIEVSMLSLGGIDIEDLDDDALELDITELGIGHIPLSLKDFVYGWHPVFLKNSSVTEDDLEGYRLWKDEGGGVFGNL